MYINNVYNHNQHIIRFRDNETLLAMLAECFFFNYSQWNLKDYMYIFFKQLQTISTANYVQSNKQTNNTLANLNSWYIHE